MCEEGLSEARERAYWFLEILPSLESQSLKNKGPKRGTFAMRKKLCTKKNKAWETIFNAEENFN